MLRENIYKLLDEHSNDGTHTSFAHGFASDTDKRFIAVLNICTRRICLSMPLLEKTVAVEFENACAHIPSQACYIESLFVEGTGFIAKDKYILKDSKIFCTAIQDGAKGIVVYALTPNIFNEQTPYDETITLPDITTDALCYLTAAELCPREYGELYDRLIYKYRDLALNCYNMQKNGGGRNSFFAGRKRKFKGLNL